MQVETNNAASLDSNTLSSFNEHLTALKLGFLGLLNRALRGFEEVLKEKHCAYLMVEMVTVLSVIEGVESIINGGLRVCISD